MRPASMMCLALLPAGMLYAQATDIGPPPGKLVDIGGRKIHIHCAGTGVPTVILEAGASAFAIDWALVQPEIARTNRVCSYDRAGSGWSEPRKTVDTPADIAVDLHSALGAAGEKPPYVMVGASMGGIYVRIYDSKYPGEVVGFLLVDPTHEDRLFTMFEGKGVPISSLNAEQMRSTIPPGPVNVRRRSPQTGSPFDSLGRDLYEVRIKLDTRLIESVPLTVPHDVVAARAEGDRAALASLHQLSATQPHPLGSRPLVVLSRGENQGNGMVQGHAALGKLSTNSRHTVVPGAGHEIHLFKPTAVIDAIRDILDSVKSGSRLRGSEPRP